MSQLTTGTHKSNSLAQLEAWVWGQESGWGPIIGIGHTNEGTAATFVFSADEPTEQAVIVPIGPDETDGEDGRQEVCRGKVFISGELTSVSVRR